MVEQRRYRRGEEVEVTHLPDCAFCMMRNLRIQAKYDGYTRQGWAFMCQRHFDLHGVGLGLGKGQRLILNTEVTL